MADPGPVEADVHDHQGYGGQSQIEVNRAEIMPAYSPERGGFPFGATEGACYGGGARIRSSNPSRSGV